jgi:two-component system, cell cycle response regulator DivK
MPTVLVVEDEANIRLFVALNLKARGYEVLPVDNAEEGLQQLRTHAPEALVLDIKLPGMSGWSMLEQIDQDPTLPKIPVIIMTASSVINQPEEVSYAHIIEKLSKPVSVDELLRAIGKAFA